MSIRSRRFDLHLVVPLAFGLLLSSVAGAQVWEVGNRLLGAGTSVPAGSNGFGLAAVAADFDDDGDDDLVVGAPYATSLFGPTTLLEAGLAEVFLGSPTRTLISSANFLGSWSESHLGSALAAGDFDGDGRPELAMGSPGDDMGNVESCGAVWIRAYETSGWTFVTSLGQDLAGVPGVAEIGDEFGSSLAVGDFDADGFADLAVGVPFENWGGTDTGAVVVFYGSISGLTGTGSQMFGAGQDGVLGTAGDGDNFGWALAAGDFDADGFADLAIGAPFRDVAGAASAGQVHLLYGSAAGLSAVGDQLLDEDDFPGNDPGSGENFGFALAAGNFDDPGVDLCAVLPTDACAADLAIGVPDQGLVPPGGGFAAGAGMVLVAYGTLSAGIDPEDSEVFSQNNLAGTPEQNDHFGRTLAAASLNGRWSGYRAADLVIGVPNEGLDESSEGYLHLVFGGFDRLGSYPGQTQFQRDGFASAPGEADTYFGSALAIGDLDGDERGDLAVGIPNKTMGGHAGAGAVQVLYSALFADGLESGLDTNWSSSVP